MKGAHATTCCPCRHPACPCRGGCRAPVARDSGPCGACRLDIPLAGSWRDVMGLSEGLIEEASER